MLSIGMPSCFESIGLDSQLPVTHQIFGKVRHKTADNTGTDTDSHDKPCHDKNFKATCKPEIFLTVF